MRLFGILLTIVNLLAGGAFVYFALQDWKGRQAITAAGLRHLLLLQGLPLEGEGFNADDETPFQIETTGGQRTETVSKKLLTAYFTANTVAAEPVAGKVSFASTEPVTNQLAEVKRVQGIITAELGKEGLTSVQKIALVGGWLLLQAETLDERIEYQTLISLTGADGKPKPAARLAEDAKTLAARLDAKFAAVINPPDGTRDTPTVKLTDVKPLAAELNTLHAALSLIQDALDTLRDARKTLLDDLSKLRQAKPVNPDAIRMKQADIVTKEGEISAKEDEFRAKDALAKAKVREMVEATKPSQTQLDQVEVQRAAVAQDTTGRRARLAHLLVHLDQDVAWQKRVAVIVGLRRYVQAIAVQAGRFKDMSARLERFLANDQADYVVHDTGLRDEAIRKAERAREVAKLKAERVDQKTAAVNDASRRRTQLDGLKDQLTKVKAEVDQLLVQQTGIEQVLFEVQREVGLTLDEVYRLETLLDEVERKRFGLPPEPTP